MRREEPTDQASHAASTEREDGRRLEDRRSPVRAEGGGRTTALIDAGHAPR